MVKVAIIDDNPQYRLAVSLLLELNENFELIHKLENGNTATASFRENTPDVVLMDIDMPGMNGIQTTWELKKTFPEIKILMLTVFEDEEKIFGAIRAGAKGYLLKKDQPQKILEAIGDVFKGESPMNGIIASKMLEYFQSSNSSQPDESSLTEKERQILQLLIKGNSYKELAANVSISVETLNSHIKNIYRKLDVHSRSELAARYNKVF